MSQIKSCNVDCLQKDDKILSETEKKTDVILIAQTPPYDGVSYYRVKFAADMLQRAGYSTIFGYANDRAYCEKVKQLAVNAKLVIASRPNSAWSELLNYLKMHTDVRIFADVDDLLLPEYCVQCGGVRSGLLDFKNAYEYSLTQMEILGLFDGLVVSTRLLKEKYDSALGFDSVVSPNRLARELIPETDCEMDLSGPFTILYPAGSYSHMKDFTVAGFAVLKFLDEHSGCSLRFMGMQEIPGMFSYLEKQGRVTHLPFMPFEDMLTEYSRSDLVIVPLEDTDFNDAKSCIKFIEAGAMRKPVLASPATEFRKVIRDGENGFLAETEKQWHQKLEYIYQNRRQCIDAGKSAFEDVIANHTTDCYQGEFAKFLDVQE